jgi:hypothetical protein
MDWFLVALIVFGAITLLAPVQGTRSALDGRCSDS